MWDKSGGTHQPLEHTLMPSSEDRTSRPAAPYYLWWYSAVERKDYLQQHGFEGS